MNICEQLCAFRLKEYGASGEDGQGEVREDKEQ